MLSKEDLEYRRTRIGASDAPDIMGVGFGTPYMKWLEKMNGSTKACTPAMKRGNDLEEPARKCFERKMNLELFARRIEHPSIPYLFSTYDGIALDRNISVEIKCGEADYQFVRANKKVPPKYIPQVQQQWETESLIKEHYFFSYDASSDDGIIIEVSRDDKYIANMLEQEAKFYDCMRLGIPPELTDKDWTNIEDEAGWQEICEQFRKEHLIRIEAERKEDELREQLILLTRERNVKGHGIQLTRSITKGAIDYSKIEELKGVDLEAYRKKSFVKWRVSTI